MKLLRLEGDDEDRDALPREDVQRRRDGVLVEWEPR